MAAHIPSGELRRGLLAGASGTAAMTAWQEISARLIDARDSDSDSDLAARPSEDPWEDAPVPAKLACKLVRTLTGRDIPPERIGLASNVTHWLYGTSLGSLYPLLQRAAPGPALRRGLQFGIGAWALSYATLLPLGLYEPPWRYSPEQLALDVSYHLAYGLGAGATYTLLQH